MEVKRMLYHVSDRHGITTLVPHSSTHKKPYVYAIDNLVTALLFGAKHDDFDFMLAEDEKGKPNLYECYPEAFSKIYKNKSCSLYELEKADFLQGITGWESEWVSESETKVQKETEIPDLFQRLQEEEQKGNLIIHRYQCDLSYRKMISEHIVDRMIRFGVLDGDWKRDIRFTLYYGKIADELIKIMGGELLDGENNIV